MPSPRSVLLSGNAGDPPRAPCGPRYCCGDQPVRLGGVGCCCGKLAGDVNVECLCICMLARGLPNGEIGEAIDRVEMWPGDGPCGNVPDRTLPCWPRR